MAGTGTIAVVGLGPGNIECLPAKNLELLRQGEDHGQVFFRTGCHPVAQALKDRGFKFETFDDLYEAAQNFEEVYSGIVDRLLAQARAKAAGSGGQVIYAVPGHPLVAETTVRMLMEAAPKAGMEVAVYPAMSALDAVYAALGLDPVQGLTVLNALDVAGDPPRLPNPELSTLILQVYNQRIASEVKLALMEVYPDDWLLTLVQAAGVPGKERLATLPLWQIDQQDWLDDLTSLYIPPRSEGDAHVGPTASQPGAGNADSTGSADRPDSSDSTNTVGSANTAGRRDRAGGADSPGTLSAPATAGSARIAGTAGSAGSAGSADRPDTSGSTHSRSAHFQVAGSCDYPLDPLVEVMAHLRSDQGCPWDREQTHQSLKRFLIEEAYEVLEAIDSSNVHKLREELGDLLLQVVFHAELASERGDFDVNDVVEAIVKKLIHRHPHVFGQAEVDDARQVERNWERIKAGEKEDNGEGELLEVPPGLPALLKAQRIQEKASRLGFDWPELAGAWPKLGEEVEELKQAIQEKDVLQMAAEMGDLLFSIVNISRFLGISAEEALQSCCTKFVRRFAYVAAKIQESGRNLAETDLAEMDRYWEEAKKADKP